MEWTDILAIVAILCAPIVGVITFRVRRRQTFKRLMRLEGFSEEYIERAIKDEGF